MPILDNMQNNSDSSIFGGMQNVTTTLEDSL